MPPTASPSKPLFAPGMARRMWSRLWPVAAFYALATPAGIIRAVADDIGLPVRRDFSALERVLLTDAPTLWFQGSLLDVHFAHLAATTVYITWFLVPITTAIGVLMFRPRDYWRFIAFLLLLYYAVMPFFVLYPLEAPWAQDPTIHRFVAEMFPEAAAQDPNPYAAMPSLHVALPAAAALWYGLRTFWGRLVLAYSALIGLVVVYGGDHYAADVAAGYAIAFATYASARRLKLPVFARDGELHVAAAASATGVERFPRAA
jgi:membrane-associated phospholipid phosphatase